MNDRGWMLNPSAIQAARRCIQIVAEELDIKLKLSHPQFLELLQEYAELTDSDELYNSLADLLVFAGVKAVKEDRAVGQTPEKSRSQNEYRAMHKKALRPANMADAAVKEFPEDSRMVEYRGKLYLRVNEQGLTFQGLYRGQPRYA